MSEIVLATNGNRMEMKIVVKICAAVVVQKPVATCHSVN